MLTNIRKLLFDAREVILNCRNCTCQKVAGKYYRWQIQCGTTIKKSRKQWVIITGVRFFPRFLSLHSSTPAGVQKQHIKLKFIERHFIFSKFSLYKILSRTAL